MSEQEEFSYWYSFIKFKFNENLNLFAEFQMSRSKKTYFSNQPIFNDGHKLKDIEQKELLLLIKKFIDEKFTNCQYYVMTRSKDDSQLLYSCFYCTKFTNTNNVSKSKYSSFYDRRYYYYK